MPLSFTTEREFLAAFPTAARYIKANDPESPCFEIKLTAGHVANVSKAGWVSSFEDITNAIEAETKLVLVNLPTKECYACEIGATGHAVGYSVRPVQPAGPVTVYATRTEDSPLLAFPVSGTVKVNGHLVESNEVVFCRLQDGTIGVVEATKLSGMKLDTSGMFDGTTAVAIDSEAIYASEPLTEEYRYVGLEGSKVAPVGARLGFSDSKNLYFITPDGWNKMKYARVG